MLNTEDKGVNDATCPPEARSLSGSSLPGSNWPSSTNIRQSAEKPQHEAAADYAGICHTSHQAYKCGTRPFLVGSGRRAEAHMRPAVTKIPRALLAFP